MQSSCAFRSPLVGNSSGCKRQQERQTVHLLLFQIHHRHSEKARAALQCRRLKCFIGGSGVSCLGVEAMRRAAVILMLALVSSRGQAAKQVTVDQLEQLLTASQTKADPELARQLSDSQLSQQITSTRLLKLRDKLPGAKSRQALTALADYSAFLPLPPAEIPSTSVPDIFEQKRIMSLVVAYVSKAIPQLPNFIATRKTVRFEDTPLLQRIDYRGFTPYEPLHYLDSSSVTVFYQDGREVIESADAKGQKPRPTTEGLNTWGVFGPILGTMLVDAAQSKLAWAHWENGPTGLQAVFSYSVPKEKSHYAVNYCCVAEEAAVASANVHPFQRLVGYHGEITADSATGTILRLTVEAEMKASDPVVKAEIMVEYGPVEIGGKSYICPVRSVSSTRAQTLQLDPTYRMPLAREMQPLKNSLSDVTFENYHVFRSESRVLASNDVEAAGAGTSAGIALSNSNKAASPAESPTGENPPSQSQAGAAQAESDTAAAINQQMVATRSPTTKEQETAPEISVSAADGLPNSAPNPASAAAASGFTLRSTSRLVDLSLVAFDKKGHPVTDLKREDFAVYDNGIAQKIRFFSQAAATASSEAAGPATSASRESQPAVYSNRQTTETGTGQQIRAAERETTALLIDSSNLAWGDLTYAREEMLRFLKTVPADERVGLYVLKSYGFQILMEPTVDHASLAAMLSKWMPSAQDLTRAQDEEKRNRQQIDFVHSATDLAHLNGNQSTDPETYASGSAVIDAMAHPTDAKLRNLGSNSGRDVLPLLNGVGRHLAAIPGHKSLIWIASDNVLADWTNQSATKEDEGSSFLHSAALSAQETLNEAHVSIYPLDASQIEAGVISADLRERNAVPIGMTSRSEALAALGDADPGMKPGRETARMQQDLHPIQGEYRDLAEATGGRALRRAGDIAAELSGIVEDGRASYQLSFSPNTPADEKFHNITVKIASRKDVTLRYRTGYLYSKEPETMKDRFRQAIWQPRDAGEIGVSAEPRKTGTGYSLKLNIAAVDLGLKEQDGFWTDKLDIFLIARDEATAKTRVTGQTLGLHLKPATCERVLRDGIALDRHGELEPEDGSVRLVVVDENSGRIGTVTVPASALGAK
jgi:VWFA-related protein